MYCYGRPINLSVFLTYLTTNGSIVVVGVVVTWTMVRASKHGVHKCNKILLLSSAILVHHGLWISSEDFTPLFSSRCLQLNKDKANRLFSLRFGHKQSKHNDMIIFGSLWFNFQSFLRPAMKQAETDHYNHSILRNFIESQVKKYFLMRQIESLDQAILSCYHWWKKYFTMLWTENNQYS